MSGGEFNASVGHFLQYSRSKRLKNSILTNFSWNLPRIYFSLQYKYCEHRLLSLCNLQAGLRYVCWHYLCKQKIQSINL